MISGALSTLTFSRARYEACVKDAVSNLQDDRLLNAKVATWYLQQAKAPLPEWVR